MSPVRDLADRFHQRWLEENPFTVTGYGIPGYDDLVPDESEAGAQAITWAEGVLAEPAPGAALSPRPPQGWPGAAAWEEERRAVRIYITLPLSPEELHQTGLDHIAALEARAVQLGAGLGLSGLDEVFAALRDSAGKIPPEEAIRQAAVAVKRAGARAPEVFPDPLPAPCDVTPMPEVVATSGAAPHYTSPRLDGGRPGTFWFNTERPIPGTGWLDRSA